MSFGVDPLKMISSKGGTLVHSTAGALRARDHLQAKPRHQDPQQLLRHGLELETFSCKSNHADMYFSPISSKL